MTVPFLNLASAIILSAAVSTHAFAASTAGSSASDSASSATSSASDSSKTSSGGSSKATGIAMGDYKIIEVAAVSDRPGKALLTLQAAASVAPAEPVLLYVPIAVVEKSGLVAGQTITAQTRTYGVEFSKQNHSNDRTAFFLVLNDDVYRELQSVAVSL